jgi:tRNA U34 5-methylaminomethyl-2-thiouridine-forming methyltransferase MnmC
MKKENEYLALTPSKKAIKIISNWLEKEKKGDLNSRKKAAEEFKKCLIKTEDGSYTLNSDECFPKPEKMHTYHGAITESLEKYIKPSKLERKNNIRILDLCSGLGYNTASCLEYFDKKKKMEIDMVEISKETVAAALLIENPFKSYEFLKSIVEEKFYKEGYLGFKSYNEKIPDGININIYIKDAREVVEKFENEKSYDAIFLDPFSPIKSPELFTFDFFLKLKNLLKSDGLILTYTSAAPVRSAMVLSGLHVGVGPRFGRSGGTIASKNSKLIDKSLSLDDERMIALSDVGIPFKDPQFNRTSLKIIDTREKERKYVRGFRKFASTVKTPLYLNKEMEDSRLKRRVLKSMKMLGIESLKSENAAYIVCPQFDECICTCGIGKLDNSRDRINEMSKRLENIIEKKI